MKIKEAKKLDLNKIMENDPAATTPFVVRHTYTGYKALCTYRYANWFYKKNMHNIAQFLSIRAKKKTGVEIHPGATIGCGIFIDHGIGLVIGETTVIGNDCILYQGVTLGGTGKDTGKRHPTLEDNVMVSAGAKVLGPVKIGSHSKIGAGSVVLKDVPPYCTVVGVPGRVVKQDGVRVSDMDQILLPDPIMEEFKRLNRRVVEMEERLDIHTSHTNNALEEIKDDIQDFIEEVEYIED